MRAIFRRHHAIAFYAVERDVDFEGLGHQSSLPQRIKNPLRIEWTVIIPNASVISQQLNGSSHNFA